MVIFWSKCAFHNSEDPRIARKFLIDIYAIMRYMGEVPRGLPRGVLQRGVLKEFTGNAVKHILCTYNELQMIRCLQRFLVPSAAEWLTWNTLPGESLIKEACEDFKVRRILVREAIRGSKV